QINNSSRERKTTLVDAITYKTIWELPQDITKAIPETGNSLGQDYPFKRSLTSEMVDYSKMTLEYACPPPPNGDLDGDGFPDVFRYAREIDYQNKSTKRYLNAYSGKDGRLLWRAPHVSQVLHCRKLGRKPYSDLLCSRTADTGLMVLDGRT